NSPDRRCPSASGGSAIAASSSSSSFFFLPTLLVLSVVLSLSSPKPATSCQPAAVRTRPRATKRSGKGGSVVSASTSSVGRAATSLALDPTRTIASVWANSASG